MCCIKKCTCASEDAVEKIYCKEHFKRVKKNLYNFMVFASVAFKKSK